MNSRSLKCTVHGFVPTAKLKPAFIQIFPLLGSHVVKPVVLDVDAAHFRVLNTAQVIEPEKRTVKPVLRAVIVIDAHLNQDAPANVFVIFFHRLAAKALAFR